MTNAHDGLYFTGWRGGLGFVRLVGNKAKVYPVLFDKQSTFAAWRIQTLSIPFSFIITVEVL
jgi:hypothetical protein